MTGFRVRNDMDRDKYCSRMTGGEINEKQTKLLYVEKEMGIWEGERTRFRGVLHVETPHRDLS